MIPFGFSTSPCRTRWMVALRALVTAGRVPTGASRLPYMPDVLLFGASGYTGRLTAHALARRQIDFTIAGRDRAKLESLASEVGDPEIKIASVGDIDSLAAAL